MPPKPMAPSTKDNEQAHTGTSDVLVFIRQRILARSARRERSPQMTKNRETDSSPARSRPTKKYRHEELGYNYRMDEMQGAILNVKLRHLDTWNRVRREKAAYYKQKLAATSVVLPSESPERRHVWHQFVVRSPHRDKLRDELLKARIGAGLHYPFPCISSPPTVFLGIGQAIFRPLKRSLVSV